MPQPPAPTRARAIAPAPAYPPEAPLNALGAAELLLVTLWRLHAAATAGCGRAARWQDGLAAAGLGPAAVRECRSFFTLLNAGAPGSAPRPPRCPSLAEDEGRLLQLIGLLQRGQRDPAHALLAAWLPPTLARLVPMPAEALAHALVARHLTLPLRAPEPAWPVRPTTSDRGLTLLH